MVSYGWTVDNPSSILSAEGLVLDPTTAIDPER